MAVINKLMEIWDDLENAYEAKGDGLTRKEFLLKYIGYKNGATTLDMLKSKIMKEYEGNEQLSDVLIRIFDAINLNLEQIVQVEEITDLNTFVGELTTAVSSTPATAVVEIADDFFQKLNPFEQRATTHVSILDLITKIGVAADYFSIDSSGTSFNYIAAEDNDAGILRSSNLHQFVANAKSGQDLFVKAYHAIQYLLEKYDFGRTMLFLGKSKFSVIGKKFIVEDNGVKVELPVVEHKKLPNVNCYIAQHRVPLGEVLVIGVC